MPTAHFQPFFCRCIIGEDRQTRDSIICDFTAEQAVSVSNRSELTKCQLLYFAVTRWFFFFKFLLSLLQNQKVIVHFWNAQLWRNLSFLQWQWWPVIFYPSTAGHRCVEISFRLKNDSISHSKSVDTLLSGHIERMWNYAMHNFTLSWCSRWVLCHGRREYTQLP